MNRLEIRQKFREENPEITDRVVTDAVLNAWLLSGNREVCCLTRCIVSEESYNLQATVNIQKYDLTENISKFYDIDDMPGGGVYYNDKPLTKSSQGEMNQTASRWKARTAGTPKFYWRRGKYLWLDCPAAATGDDIEIDYILLPDAFDSDAKYPFNELDHLQTFDDALVKYLQLRNKQRVGKQEEASIARQDYKDYVDWMKKTVSGYSRSASFMRVKASA